MNFFPKINRWIIPEAAVAGSFREMALDGMQCNEGIVLWLGHRNNGQAEVTHLEMQDPQRLKKLIAIGVLPGSQITLLQRFPSYVFQIGWSQFSIDRELASSIYVKSGPHDPAG